ncbi:hypothetical protein JOB18_016269 [Solea senegalensis]|uniref:Uncharacterized protein n=1 Tax=Solea senegalensis TaxID=28829 RepID=A0AAV6R4Q3_SOLSE|nr:hypothetical protein JOB18_016269 [Solea senegalensis]
MEAPASLITHCAMNVLPLKGSTLPLMMHGEKKHALTCSDSEKREKNLLQTKIFWFTSQLNICSSSQTTSSPSKAEAQGNKPEDKLIVTETSPDNPDTSHLSGRRWNAAGLVTCEAFIADWKLLRPVCGVNDNFLTSF